MAAGEAGVPPTFPVGYLATYSDSIAPNLTLYYDLDAVDTNYNSGPIGSITLPAGESGIEGSYAWNISGLPSGAYYVRGVLDDGVNPAVADYSDGVLTIGNPNPAILITSLEADRSGRTPAEVFVFDPAAGNLSINFRASGGVFDNEFYLSADASLDTGLDTYLGSVSGSGDLSLFLAATGWAHGSYYIIGRRATGISQAYPVVADGKPLIDLTTPAGAPVVYPVNNEVVIDFSATDADGDALVSLYYSPAPVFDAAAQLIVSDLASTDTTYTWPTGSVNPGVYYVYGRIQDGNWQLLDGDQVDSAPALVEVLPRIVATGSVVDLTGSGQGILPGSGDTGAAAMAGCATGGMDRRCS